MNQNNILVVMADQLTALALRCYAHAHAYTPHLDAFALNAMVFDATYSSSPLCTPARFAFMTGQQVSRAGGYDNAA